MNEKDQAPSPLHQAIVTAMEAAAEAKRAMGGDRELSLVQTKLEEALMWNATRDNLRAQRGLGG